MNRIMVIGNAGGGKSTLCRNLSVTLGLPCHSIDDLQWKPGWVATPDAEYDAAHSDVIAGDHWLIDGYGPWSSVLARLEHCDTVILIDHPIRVHFWWALKRQIASLLGQRRDGAKGCPMWPVTVRLFRMMWHLHRVMRPRLIEAIYARADQVLIVHVRSPKELRSFARAPETRLAGSGR